MKNGKNGHTLMPVPVPMIQFTLDGGAVLPVHDEPDRAGAALDEWDTEIATLNQAFRDQAVARELLADASRRVEVARERCRLLRAAIAVQLSGEEVR